MSLALETPTSPAPPGLSSHWTRSPSPRFRGEALAGLVHRLCPGYCRLPGSKLSNLARTLRLGIRLAGIVTLAVALVTAVMALARQWRNT
jgi:hypothetical protein